MPLPGRHVAPQLVGIARAVIGPDDCDLHYLFLKQRHTECALEYRAQFWMRVLNRFLLIAPTQIGMHHLPLNRPGAHDGNFDYEVVEATRPQAWQHYHLCAALDLKHA